MIISTKYFCFALFKYDAWPFDQGSNYICLEIGIGKPIWGLFGSWCLWKCADYCRTDEEWRKQFKS